MSTRMQVSANAFADPAEVLAWINARTPDASYYDHELRRMIEFTRLLPVGARICEIGVYGGRTAATYLLEQVRRFAAFSVDPQSEAAPDHAGTGKEFWWWLNNCAFDLHLIDAWVLNEGDARPGFDRLVADLADLMPVRFTPHWCYSQAAAPRVPAGIDLLHIDGDHRDGARIDCELYLPKMSKGGIVVIHDYGKAAEYPMVIEAVNAYFCIDTQAGLKGELWQGRTHCTLDARGVEWELLGTVGSQFAARKAAR